MRRLLLVLVCALALCSLASTAAQASHCPASARGLCSLGR